ncbi:MAG: hypothetical protein KTR21_14890 [Rhodobacteraceae bacterium]|nr:hypothetical protein [Paracoccaceae bacterium]
MSDQTTQPQTEKLVLEYELDAAPEKVWRAVSSSAYREQWLPKAALVDEEAVSITPGEEVRYRMRDDEPPFLESVVTFQIAPTPAGGATLTIIHELTDPRVKPRITAANSNRQFLLRAA